MAHPAARQLRLPGKPLWMPRVLAVLASVVLPVVVRAELLVPPPLALHVAVEMLNTEGECRGASFTGDDVRRNDALPGKPTVFVGRIR